MLTNKEKQEEPINNEHDKIFRKILDYKKETVKFLNKVLKPPRKLTVDDIEKFNSKFVTDELLNSESDVIYKIKDKEIYILIEHQTKVDHSMTYRILKYEYLIMDSVIDKKKVKNKGYIMPVVIPIVLYTGARKWNAKVMMPKFKDMEISKYIVVDVNNYSEEQLLKEPSFLSKAMLIEKMRDTKRLAKVLLSIIIEMN